jgi:hypothetical protein
MSLLERVLTRLFPSENLPWGTRWKVCGQLTGREDTSRSLLKKPLSLPSGRSHYLHRMTKPDADRDTHDHRYDWSSRILAGSYLEVVRDPNGTYSFRTYQRGEVNRKDARVSHRIQSVVGPCWTWFATGPAYRDWGFTTASGQWFHHDDYAQMRRDEAKRRQG